MPSDAGHPSLSETPAIETEAVPAEGHREGPQVSLDDEFYLDDSEELEITGTPADLEIHRWLQVAHCREQRRALVLVAGEELQLISPVAVQADTRLFVRYAAALPRISADGLTCELAFRDVEAAVPAELLAVLPVAGGVQPPEWSTAVLALDRLAGRSGHLVVRCRPGWQGDPTADWLALADLCLAREDRLSLVRSRTFHRLRASNELEHFRSVYQHSMYARQQDRLGEAAGRPERPVRTLSVPPAAARAQSRAEVSPDDPLPEESPYAYASRLLDSHLPSSAPDFAARLVARAAGGRVKVLSLCSGAARFEASMAALAGGNVSWSLLDISSELLQSASRQFAPELEVDLIEGNANALTATGETWDVILCVSGLHHLVELETVTEFCHRSLTATGELWLIGEYVGRNGNRLWPEARVAANDHFRQLPERLRRNRHSGEVDAELPDNDYSVGCFEGIRSEEIEPIVDRWFTTVESYRRNCFLWRIVNLAYSDNYDLAREEDRSWLALAVGAELRHFRSGGRGTGLFGIYRPRPLG